MKHRQTTPRLARRDRLSVPSRLWALSLLCSVAASSLIGCSSTPRTTEEMSPETALKRAEKIINRHARNYE